MREERLEGMDMIAVRHRDFGTKALQSLLLTVTFIAAFGFTSRTEAQYFRSASTSTVILEADDLDSVILTKFTPFSLPENGELPLVYHEPLPDSVMPRSAVMIGTLRIQAEESQDVVEYLEDYARDLGADWIVSFAEPRAQRSKAGERIFRATATLLKVMDPSLIKQQDVHFSYYEENKLSNYAAVNTWYDTYGRHLGEKLDTQEINGDNGNTEEDFDR